MCAGLSRLNPGFAFTERPVFLRFDDNIDEYIFEAHAKTIMQAIRYMLEEGPLLLRGVSDRRVQLDENEVRRSRHVQKSLVVDEIGSVMFGHNREMITIWCPHDLCQSLINDIADCCSVVVCLSFEQVDPGKWHGSLRSFDFDGVRMREHTPEVITTIISFAMNGLLKTLKGMWGPLKLTCRDSVPCEAYDSTHPLQALHERFQGRSGIDTCVCLRVLGNHIGRWR